MSTEQELELAAQNVKTAYRQAAYVLNASASSIVPANPGTIRADAVTVLGHLERVRDAVETALEMLKNTTVGVRPGQMEE